ncbi:myelin protein zero-like protein 1 isoform X2 [Anomalospiza imberbis]|uniref:myelin protein zero-like protein 1 isoform X2 n=1 Tax=Anomalospiza imberbis TaxID=187417 RepID=UPI00358E6D30
MEVTVTLAFASTVTVSKTILPMVQYIPRSGMKVGDPRHSSQSNDEKAKLWKTRLRGDLINMYKYLKVQVSAVEVNTPEEMFVENGTDAKLPCTFTSVEVISSAASVSWSFQPEGAATRISFFYYSNGKSYPGKDIPFKDRITWAGDLNKKDASITISNMQFRDNGTYICDVKNPPDIVVKPGEIRVRVVEKDSLPAFPIATVAGIAIGTVTGLSSLISIVVCLVIRKNNSKKRYSGCSTSESLMSPVKQAPQKAPSDTEGLVNSVPARSHQGPVIYAQLDHSGGQHSDKINKSESVVYADIRKN